jgi:hypothetical protein
MRKVLFAAILVMSLVLMLAISVGASGTGQCCA